MTNEDIKWGPTGELVYQRTYSRTKPDGSKETWPETVERVVDGNLALVEDRYHLEGERQELIDMMTEFKVLPGGRHLWASGVKNAQHLFNCWVSGWTEKPSDHFEFTFTRLMEGGGVGANYSNRYLEQYPPVQQELYVHIVCDPEHPDFEDMVNAGLLSTEYDPDWAGAYIIEDSREGWASALVDLVDTHYREEVSHYQRVYDVSRVRHAGAKLKTFGGRASGPAPLARMLIDVCEILSERAGGWDGHRPGPDFWLSGMDAMAIDHAIAQCVVAGGVRRSARMAMMHWNDPQITEFVNCKQDSKSHWTTNISVEVDEEFWKYVNNVPTGEHSCSQAATVARNVLTTLSQGAVRNGEPGMWDSSLSNVGEPNTVTCTNPCGEITLQEWEPCNLGHVNLAAFVGDDRFSWGQLRRAHELMTRFLIRATFSEVSDPKSREVLDRNRRIGLGHFGVASFLAMEGIRFSEAQYSPWFRSLLTGMAEYTERAAREYCHQLRIPVPVKTRTIAPTGTVAKLPGVSEGIHPIFSQHFIRRVRFNKGGDDLDQVDALGDQGYYVEEDKYAPNTLVVEIPTKDTLVQQVEDKYGSAGVGFVESAADLTLDQMLAFQAMYQKYWADNAVSFTANVDPGKYTANNVGDLLRKYGGQLKGSTIFPEQSFEQAPYERITKEEYDAAVAKAVADGVDEECSSGSCPIR